MRRLSASSTLSLVYTYPAMSERVDAMPLSFDTMSICDLRKDGWSREGIPVIGQIKNS